MGDLLAFIAALCWAASGLTIALGARDKNADNRVLLSILITLLLAAVVLACAELWFFFAAIDFSKVSDVALIASTEAFLTMLTVVLLLRYREKITLPDMVEVVFLSDRGGHRYDLLGAPRRYSETVRGLCHTSNMKA